MSSPYPFVMSSVVERSLHALRLVEMTLDGAVDDIGRGDLKFVFHKRFHGLVAG